MEKLGRQVVSVQRLFNHFTISRSGPLLGHFLITAIFFSAFLLFHRVLICSTDALGINLPMLWLAKQNFWRGELGLWFPYSSAGQPSSHIAVAPILSVDNFFHFLFPDRYFFLVLTGMALIKFLLVGLISYKIFYMEFKDRRWAFFSSVCFQLCGFSIWSTMIYDSLTLLVFQQLALYLIWTFEKRSSLRNLFFLTLTLTALLFSSVVIYGLYAVILVGLMSGYRFFSGVSRESRKAFITIVGVALTTALLISLIRVLPTLADLKGSTRELHTVPRDFRDYTFLALRLFIPEVFGVAYYSSLDFFTKLGSFFFGQHFHSLMPEFFGALTSFLILYALFCARRGKLYFWKWYVLSVLALVLFLKPFDLMVKMWGRSLYHQLSLHILLPFGMCMLAGHAALQFEKTQGYLSTRSKIFLALAVGLVVSYAVLAWGLYFDEYAKYFAATAALLVLGIAALTALWVTDSKHLERLVSVMATALALTSLLLLFLVKSENQTFLSHFKLSLVSILLMSVTFLSVRVWRSHERITLFAYAAIAAAITVAFYILVIPWASKPLERLSQTQDLMIAALGLTKWILAAGVFAAIVASRRASGWQRGFFPLCLALLLSDLVPAAKVHSFAVLNPFYPASSPLEASPLSRDAAGNKTVIDTVNYRLNHPNRVLGIKIEKEVPFMDTSLAYAIYGARSIGGYVNAVPLRYERLLRNFLPDLPDITHGFAPEINDERLLDLLGVKYDYDFKSGQLLVRPNALSRWMFFTDYTVINSEEETLSRLKSADFAFQNRLILERAPGIRPTPQAARRMTPREIHSDRSLIYVDSPSAGVLFFGDSFNADWKARVDGQPAEVLRANFDFMGVAVPAGKHRVEFSYEPVAFRRGIVGAWLGAVIFALSVIGLCWQSISKQVRLLKSAGLSPRLATRRH